MVAAQTLILALAIAGTEEPVLLEFSAAWCGPCQSMEPIVRRLTSDGYPVRKIDVDQDPAAATRFGITGLPSFVMLADGREVDRVVGAASFARLQQMYERAQAQSGRRGSTRGQSPDGSAAEPIASRYTSEPRTTSEPRPISSPSRTIPDLALAATVRLKIDDQNGTAFGTGTIIDLHGKEALVVTCGHIFRDTGGKGPITVESFDGTAPRRGQLISFDLDRDIGLVSFEPGGSVHSVQVAASGSAIRRGSRVFSIGCDRGAEPSLRTSHITSVDRYAGPPNIEVAGQPVEGRSGGGLFTEDGMLIGICNFADPADDEGIYASLATIQWELDRVGQRRVYQRRPAELAGIATASPRVEQFIGKRRPAMPNEMPPEIAITPNRETEAPLVHNDDLEVICIVRSRSNPRGENRVFVLDNPSSELLGKLTGAPRSRGAAHVAASTGLTPVQDRGRTRRGGPVVRAQSADR